MFRIRIVSASAVVFLVISSLALLAEEGEIKAKIDASKLRVTLGEPVFFDSNASVPGEDAEFVGFYWDFNDMDQVRVDRQGRRVSHIFNKTGAYTVKLTVENNRGERDEASVSIEVLPDTESGPVITDNFQGGKTGLFVDSKETFAFRLEWGGQFYFRIDNCKNVPLSLKIFGYGPNRKQLNSVTPYTDDYSFDEKFTLMYNIDYQKHLWQPLTDAEYTFDQNSASITVRFTPATESVYLAWAAPYTMRHLESFIDRWENDPRFSCTTIGLSVEGRPIYAITITDPDTDNQDKKVVWITGTQHAYEMAAGPVCQGIVETLLEGSDSSRAVLKQCVYHMVPLINPDGVAHGGYRYNMHDIDLNRNWDHEALNDWDSELSEPEVASVKRAIDEWVSRGNRLDFFFDFHCLTALSKNLLMIKAAPDSIPSEIAAEQDRFVREFFAKKYFWRISESKSIGSANGYISDLYAARTGVLSFTSEHALGFITPAGGELVRSTPAHWRKLGADYVWTIKEYFDSKDK